METAVNRALKPQPHLSKPKKDEDVAQVQKKADQKKKQADEVARDALRLKENEASPDPTLSPSEHASLDKLAPREKKMAMAVLGCTQEMKKKVDLAREQIIQKSLTQESRAQRTTFSQRLIQRRAENNSMSPQDVAKAKEIISHHSAQERLDIVESGASEIFQQSQDMLVATRMMAKELSDGMNGDNAKPHEAVIKILESQAGFLNDSIQLHQGEFRSSDIQRLSQAVIAHETIGRDAAARHIPTVGSPGSP